MENVDAQRGEGVHRDSIAALLRLNEVGYGIREDLPLRLVYNPVGAHLPPAQGELEAAYRKELWERHGVRFTSLYTLANMPIGQFQGDLRRAGKLDSYRELLKQTFNPETVEGLMCRRQISVDWLGRLYDCDFNLALRLPVRGESPANIRDFSTAALRFRRIATGDHCFGCTAGAGSSCGGALAQAG
jgi:radical SAM/Cys-rich protein